MQTPVPPVEVTDDAQAPRVRRPHREGSAGHAFVLACMRAESAPQRAMSALAEQVQVHVAQGGPEAVRIVDGERALPVVDVEPVPRRRVTRDRSFRKHRLEQAVRLQQPGGHTRTTFEHDGHARRLGTKSAHDRPVALDVGPEETVRIAQIGDLNARHYDVERRRRAANGMRTQSGRCACS